MPVAEQQLLPAYLIVGTDEYKRERAVKRMKARLEETGMAEFNMDERDLSREPEMDDVIASLNTFPLGAQFRLVILRGCDHLPKAVSEPLVDYLRNPAPTTVCLIIAESLAKNTRLYKAVAALGEKAVIDCSPKKSWELPRYVMQMARGHGKQITQPAAEELIARVGDNTRTLDNELERLSNQTRGAVIEREDVERIVARTAEAKPWGFLDAVCERDLPRALEQLELQPSGSEVLLWTLLVRRIRELIYTKSLDARGEGGNLASTLGLQAWQVKKHHNWARNYTMEELVDALSGAVEVEQDLKGSRDSALALRMWVIEIVQRP